MSKTFGEMVFEKASARMENSPLLEEPKMVRVHVYSEMNMNIDFDISVPEVNLDTVRQTVPIAGKKWFNDPDYQYSGWAEPLMDMLEDLGIPYELHSDLNENVVIHIPFV